VGEVSAALTSLLDLDEILDRVGRTLTEGLQLRAMTVVLWIGGSSRVLSWDHGVRRMVEMRAAPVEAIRQRLEVERDGVRMRLVDRSADGAFAREADGLGAALIVPLTLGGGLVGAFALGPPRSGRLFTRQDVELLRTLAAQSAIAIGNARSYRALRAANEELEAKVQARTAALAASHRELTQAYQDLQMAQTQLVHGEKMASLGVLVAGVAHEINNPVSFIVGGVEPLRRIVDELREFVVRHPDRALEEAVERAHRAIEAIARGAERTAGIVKDLRTFSRSGESRALPVDVREGIEVSLRLLQPRWANRITIHRDFASLPLVEAAPDELNQVWMNLLANACDAIAEGGNIWIRTEGGADGVVVVVRDDGRGIPSEKLSRIFDPFFTTKEPGKGTGLGLAVTHGIVVRHGGRITVESVPGLGTQFTVTLPWQRPPSASAGARQAVP
jgi:signal transduction histidine kinase